MYPLAIKNIPKINKEFLTDKSNLYDMWSQQSTHACQSTLQASPLNCCTFLSPPPLHLYKKKIYHDLHVSPLIHPKNSLKFYSVIQKCWHLVYLCDLFFCGFYNQFQQRQRSGRNKICRKYCCRVFKRQIRDCSLFHYRPGACHTCFYYKFEVSELPVCLSEFHLHIMTYQKWLVKLWIILFKKQFA